MACRLFGTKPLSKPVLGVIVNWTLRDKLQGNLIIIHNFHSRKASENIVCEMRGHFVQGGGGGLNGVLLFYLDFMYLK